MLEAQYMQKSSRPRTDDKLRFDAHRFTASWSCCNIKINVPVDFSIGMLNPHKLEDVQIPVMSTAISRLPAQWQNERVTIATGPGKLKRQNHSALS